MSLKLLQVVKLGGLGRPRAIKPENCRSIFTVKTGMVSPSGAIHLNVSKENFRGFFEKVRYTIQLTR